MARFGLKGRHPSLSVVRLLLRHLFQTSDSRFTGRFISGDEGHGPRQRFGYPVTPHLSLSCPMHAGNKPGSLQKMSAPG